MSQYDVIVLGLGAMGSATVAHLARRGVKTLGLEAFQQGHALGSSHGRSRIIREAYLEAPDYVPIVQRAYQLWRELEHETGTSLLTITGGLNIGAADSDFVTGAARSAAQFNLPIERLTNHEVHERFPGFQLPDDIIAIYEPTAGVLRPEESNAAHIEVARRHGADIRFNTPVLSWTADQSEVTVSIGTESFSAERLVVTAGPWSAEVLTELGLPLQVRRIVNAHFDSTRPELFSPDICPVYLMQLPEGDYYGFPAFPGEGVKLGRHDIGEITTADTVRREIDDAEVEALRAILDRYMPGASGPVTKSLTCMYTDTPDSHFIIEKHPAHANVAYGCGFSGHGFKFASAIGEILADLALEGETRHEIGFLSSSRLASAT